MREMMEQTKIKCCKYCNKPIERKTYEGGRKESIKQYNGRTYCDRSCMSKDYTKNRYVWDEEKEKKLIQCYKDKMDVQDIAKLLNKTPTSIKAKAHSLGITNREKYYTKEELDFIIKNKDKLTYEQMSEVLNRNYMNICRKFKELGIDKERVQNVILTEEQMKGRNKKQRETKIKNGTLNPMKNQSSPYSRAKGGKRKDLGDTYFRSAWEANIARYYNYLGIKWEYEPKTFIFKNITRGSVSYTPDFYLPEEDKWIEVKGWMDGKSKTKLKRFKNQYPEEYSKLVLIQEKEYNSIKKKLGCFIKNWE